MRVGGPEHVDRRAAAVACLIALAPCLALVGTLCADAWVEPIQEFLRAHSFLIDRSFENGLRVLGPYVVLGLAIALVGREGMALVFGLFPTAFAIAMASEDMAWRSAYLFYPLVIVGHGIYSLAGWWELGRAVAAPLHTRVALDRGGLRVERGSGRQYWPLELLESVDVEASTFVARATGGIEIARIPVSSGEARAAALGLRARFDARKKRARPDGELPKHLDSLGDFRRALDAAWQRGTGPSYRSLPADLTRFLGDDVLQGASGKWSAAVSYFSIRLGGAPRERALERLGADTSPIELALAAIAAGTRHVVPSHVWFETTSYLDRDQKDELEELLVNDWAEFRRCGRGVSPCPCTTPADVSPPFDAAARRALPSLPGARQFP